MSFHALVFSEFPGLTNVSKHIMEFLNKAGFMHMSPASCRMSQYAARYRTIATVCIRLQPHSPAVDYDQGSVKKMHIRHIEFSVRNQIRYVRLYLETASSIFVVVEKKCLSG